MYASVRGFRGMYGMVVCMFTNVNDMRAYSHLRMSWSVSFHALETWHLRALETLWSGAMESYMDFQRENVSCTCPAVRAVVVIPLVVL